MLIAVGTQNKAKLQACHTALKKLCAVFPQLPDPEEIEIKAFTVDSGVADMPLTLEALKTGARNRALSVLKQPELANRHIDFAIGMEGGVYQIGPGESAFLQSWVYARRNGRGFYGCSAGLPIPAAIARELFEHKKELAEVIDTFSGKKDVRSKEGAYGILSRNIYTRSHAFESAIVNAMVPFLNETYYGNDYETRP